MTGAYLLLPAPPKDLLKTAKSFSVDEASFLHSRKIAQYFWLTKNKILAFESSAGNGYKYQSALFNIEKSSPSHIPLLDSALSSTKNYHSECITPSQDGKHLLWIESPDISGVYKRNRGFIRNRLFPKNIVISDLEGKVIQSFSPPNHLSTLFAKWVDARRWTAILYNSTNFNSGPKTRAFGNISYPSKFDLRSETAEEMGRIPSQLLIKYSKSYRRGEVYFQRELTKEEANESDSAVRDSYLTKIKAPGDLSVCQVQFSHDKTRIAWVTESSNYTDIEDWLANTFYRQIRDEKNYADLWITNGVGLHPIYFGRIESKRSQSSYINALAWRPGDKSVSFIFNGKIYLVPVD